MPIISIIRRDFRKSFESIKLSEIEETFDIYFSRFFGYYFALLAKRLDLTPNQVSLSSLVIGIVSGVLFYFQDDIQLIIWACFFITLSGVLDSADGQLARMTGQSSDLGRKIDALIDTGVFVVCYTGGGIYFLHSSYGWWIVPIAALGGYFHSIKSGVYEYYKTEFIYYVKAAKDHRIPFVAELKDGPKPTMFWGWVLYYLELDYLRKQEYFHGRDKAHRALFEKYSFDKEIQGFKELYSKINEPIMTWWALICGTNTHRTALMVCSLFGRMDVYFFFAIVTILPLFLLVKLQNKLDRKLINALANSRVG